MESKLGCIANWHMSSGMNVNEQKTNCCLFHRGDTALILLTLNNQMIRSNKTIGMLGVISDSKLQWADHVSSAIKKSMSAINAINAIRLIKKYFNQKELFPLVTSNFYFYFTSQK